MLKIRDNVDLKELEKFGFVENSTGNYDYRRFLDGILAYRVYVTRNHHYIQIQIYEVSLIAKSLQELIYDLTKARNSRKSLGGNMENIDEDIKIVEERIDYFKNNPEGCNWKLSFEDDKDIQAIENLLSRLKTAEEELETYKKIAEKVAGLTESISKGDIKLIDTACKDIKIRECLENEKCINCILEWARKKVEDDV